MNIPRRKLFYIIFVVIGIAGIFGLIVSNFMHAITPRELTVTRMRLTEMRIRLYWKSWEKLPTDLSEIPPLPNRDNSVEDGWGRVFGYHVSGTEVTLNSAGSDSDRLGGFALQRVFDVTDDAIATDSRETSIFNNNQIKKLSR